MKLGLDRREFLRRLAAVPLAPLALRSAAAPAIWTVTTDRVDVTPYVLGVDMAAGESRTAIEWMEQAERAITQVVGIPRHLFEDS